MEAKRINQEEITVLDIEPAIINEERSFNSFRKQATEKNR